MFGCADKSRRQLREVTCKDVIAGIVRVDRATKIAVLVIPQILFRQSILGAPKTSTRVGVSKSESAVIEQPVPDPIGRCGMKELRRADREVGSSRISAECQAGTVNSKRIPVAL